MKKADKLESTIELFVDLSPVSQVRANIDDGQNAEDGDMMNDKPTHGDNILDEHGEQASIQ